MQAGFFRVMNSLRPKTEGAGVNSHQHRTWSKGMDRSRWSTALQIALLAAVSAALYANTLNHEFVWDDQHTIVANEFVHSLSNARRLLSSEFFIADIPDIQRPVSLLSCMFDYFLWGLDPLGYHLTNILLHVLNVMLVYAVTLMLTRRKWLAFVTGILFAVHPIHTEVVACINFREDLLALLFLLFGFILYLKSVSGGRLRRGVFYGFSLLACTLALFSKEMAILFTVIIPLHDLVFVRGRVGWRIVRRYLGYWALSAAYLVVLFAQKAGEYQDVVVSPAGSGYGAFVTAVKYVMTYVKLHVFPVGLCAHYVVDISVSLLEPAVLLSVSLTALLLVAAFAMRRHTPIASFGILWFVAALLPVLNIKWIPNIVAERYLYIPSVGFCFVLAAGLDWMFHASARSISAIMQRAVVLSVGVAIVVLYSVITVRRNAVWKDEFTLWRETLKVAPNSFIANANFAITLEERGRNMEAIEYYEKAIELKYDFPHAHNGLGCVYRKVGKFDEAIREFREAVRLKPNFVVAFNNLGRTCSEKGLFEDAARAYDKSLELRPGQAEICNDLGLVCLNMDRIDVAISNFVGALEIKPNYAAAQYNIGLAHDRKGDMKKAVEGYSRAIQMDPLFSWAYVNLGVVYERQGLIDKAVTCHRKAALIDSSLSKPHCNLGMIYMSQGRLEESVRELSLSLELEPDDIVARYNLAVVYTKQKRYDAALEEYEKILQAAPDNHAVHKNMGIIYLKHFKDKKKASFHLKRASEP